MFNLTNFCYRKNCHLIILFTLINNMHSYIIIDNNTTINTNSYQINLLPYQIIELNFVTNFAYAKISNDRCVNHKLLKDNEFITDDINYYFYNYYSFIPEIFKPIYLYKLYVINPVPLNKSINICTIF